ncbi:MAG: hypothetical protein KME25_11550 [Symplocastrum torsivum CPER-KK1]|uniref:Uncharacterized protein n=1 Tax=Symplocastrum torsivum CPER-KK1 TaxID=450513 RepID=A0A951PJJ0_9CYAN|nr:hypothetical protein [Symplocastrum torsivum CPER-KK1]
MKVSFPQLPVASSHVQDDLLFSSEGNRYWRFCLLLCDHKALANSGSESSRAKKSVALKVMHKACVDAIAVHKVLPAPSSSSQ